MKCYITKEEFENKELIKELLQERNVGKEKETKILELMDSLNDSTPEFNDGWFDEVDELEDLLYSEDICLLEIKHLDELEDYMREYTPDSWFNYGTMYCKKNKVKTYYNSTTLVDGIVAEDELKEIVEVLKKDKKFGKILTPKNFKKFIDSHKREDEEDYFGLARIQTYKHVYLLGDDTEEYEDGKVAYWVTMFDRKGYEGYISDSGYGIEFYKVTGIDKDGGVYFTLGPRTIPGGYVSFYNKEGKAVKSFVQCHFVKNDLYKMDGELVEAHDLAMLCARKGLTIEVL